MIKQIYKRVFKEKTRNNIREYSLRFIFPLYFGNKFYCNCCNKSFRKFHNKGNITRLNAQCPYCFSLERTRVLDLYLDKEMEIYNQSNIRVLHFAPEFGIYRKLIKLQNIEYIDADINPAYARTIIDITDIPYQDNYFDTILCSHVLGHVPDEKQAIKELYRTVKSNGTVLILTLLSDKPDTFEDKSIVSPEERLNNYGEADLCRLHGKDFNKRLEAEGFTAEEIDYRLNFSKELQIKHSLGNGEREIIFKCTKAS